MDDEVNVDALVNEAMAPDTSPEVPTEGGIPEPADTGAPPQAEAGGEGGEAAGDRVLTYKGKEISMDDDRFKAYAQKGYDYESKMHQQRVDRRMFDQEREQFQSEYGQLKEINDYAKANPAFEALIQREWQKLQAGEGEPLDPLSEVQMLQHQLRTLQDQVNSQTQANENRRIAELEATQETTIADYKDKHSYLDWEAKDAEGNSLEDRISHAMLDNGVKNFSIMADHFLKDQLMKRNALESKEAAAKGIQKANKLGLGKVTPKSTLGVKSTEGIRKKSYDQLLAEGMAELGIEL